MFFTLATGLTTFLSAVAATTATTTTTAAVAAGAAGLGATAYALKKNHETNEKMEKSRAHFEASHEKLQKKTQKCQHSLDKLCKLQMKVQSGFSEYIKIVRLLGATGETPIYSKNGITLPAFDQDKTQTIAWGSQKILNAFIEIGSVGMGVLGVASAVTAAEKVDTIVRAGNNLTNPEILCKAIGGLYDARFPVGSAKSLLELGFFTSGTQFGATAGLFSSGCAAASGVGLAGATLAGTLNATGVGLLIGSTVLALTSSSAADQAEEVWNKVLKDEKLIDELCCKYKKFKEAFTEYSKQLKETNDFYEDTLKSLKYIVYTQKKTWSDWTPAEKALYHNAGYCISLLTEMCAIDILLVSEGKNVKLNKKEINRVIDKSKIFMSDHA